MMADSNQGETEALEVGNRFLPSRIRGIPFSAALLLVIGLGLSPFLSAAPGANASAGPASAATSGGRTGFNGGGPAASGVASQPVSGTEINQVNTFAGTQHGYNGGQYDSYSPPDVQVAAGPTGVVEMVNVYEQTFAKSGSSVSVVPLSTVFGAGTHDIGDPRLVFDNSSQRFFAVVYDWTDQVVRLAVSTSAAGDSWSYFSFGVPSTNICPDQPYLGVSADKVVITANDYYAGGTAGAPCRPLGGYAYQEYWVESKASLLSGGGTYWYYTFSTYFGLRPVSSSTSTAYLVCTTCGSGLILLIQVSGVPTSSTPPAATTSYVPFGSPPIPPSAPHGGNSDLIDTNSNIEIQSTTWANGIWFTMNDGCLPAGDSAFRSCAGVVELSVSPPQVIVRTDVYGPPGNYLFYPAISVDAFGDVGLVAGYSSSALNPGVIVTGTKANEPIGNMEGNLVTVAAGTGWHCYYYRSSGLCRYGDYFGASPDPSDPSLFWFAGEYETSTGWSTSVSAIRVGLAAVTLGYSVQDGSNAPAAPSVSYTLQGTSRSGLLSTSPKTFYMDLGSSWSAGSQLGGSASERWAASGPQSGQASADTTTTLVYYHQYLVTPTSSVSGGGSAYRAPGVSCTEFGSSVTAQPGSPLWADAKSSCVFDKLLQGSAATERWATGSTVVTVAGSGSISQTYYHQFLFALGYSVTGGGLPGAPVLSSAEFGAAFSPSLTTSPTGYWLDGGASWRVDRLLTGSTSSERWVTTSTTSGVATQGVTETLTYQHQYYVSVSVTPSAGGTESATNGWYDAGSTFGLSAKESSGWKFEGWSGTGSGAFSGSSANTSFIVNGPTNETALFYPGLTITASGSGSVQYSFGTTTGTVPGGGSAVVYAPIGTTVTLTATASSFLYSFSGWGGAVSGSSSPGQLQLNGPSGVSASFGYNFAVIGGLAVLAAIVVLGLALYLRRRPGTSLRSVAPPPPAAAQAQTRFCPNCGSPVSLQATFCNQCGNKMS